MTIKLLLLKSGEDIISDIQEMVIKGQEEGDEKVIGYFLKKPCVVKLRGSEVIAEEKNKRENTYNVSMYPWIPLSKDKVIPLTTEWVITMVNPTDEVKKMYEEDILSDGKSNQSTSTTEQFNTDNSD